MGFIHPHMITILHLLGIVLTHLVISTYRDHLLIALIIVHQSTTVQFHLLIVQLHLIIVQFHLVGLQVILQLHLVILQLHLVMHLHHLILMILRLHLLQLHLIGYQDHLHHILLIMFHVSTSIIKATAEEVSYLYTISPFGNYIKYVI